MGIVAAILVALLILSSAQSKEFKQVTGTLDSPEVVESWMRRNLRYIANGRNERIQGPSATFKRKGGDCEDWAIFADYCLSKAGYSSYIVNVQWGSRQGHSFAVYRENDSLFVVGDTDKRGIQGPYSSTKEIVEQMMRGRNLRGFTTHKWHNFKRHFKG